ncbi:hypothetical protein [Microcoleus vaginatus]|uniref:hypothetical protein n=1 Tax=Microcoleus vaginatus TaxID=119532 RepID=UPI001F61C54C
MLKEEGRRKKEEGRRKREEGRRKRIFLALPSPNLRLLTLPLSHSPALNLDGKLVAKWR